jgi:hypothetical protein
MQEKSPPCAGSFSHGGSVLSWVRPAARRWAAPRRLHRPRRLVAGGVRPSCAGQLELRVGRNEVQVALRSPSPHESPSQEARRSGSADSSSMPPPFRPPRVPSHMRWLSIELPPEPVEAASRTPLDCRMLHRPPARDQPIGDPNRDPNDARPSDEAKPVQLRRPRKPFTEASSRHFGLIPSTAPNAPRKSRDFVPAG